MGELGPCFKPIFGDVIKGLLLVLGPFLIPFWAHAPIISNPIIYYCFCYNYCSDKCESYTLVIAYVLH